MGSTRESGGVRVKLDREKMYVVAVNLFYASVTFIVGTVAGFLLAWWLL